MSRLPRWRKATWAIAVVVLLAAAGIVSNQGAIIEGAAFMTWPVVLVWFLSRPRQPRP